MATNSMLQVQSQPKVVPPHQGVTHHYQLPREKRSNRHQRGGRQMEENGEDEDEGEGVYDDNVGFFVLPPVMCCSVIRFSPVVVDARTCSVGGDSSVRLHTCVSSVVIPVDSS